MLNSVLQVIIFVAVGNIVVSNAVVVDDVAADVGA
jgi:hypothetical protein